MTWEEIGELAADPLVTIGAHTVNHVMLAKVPDDAVRSEMELSRAVIEAALGVRPAASSLSGRRPHLGRAARIRDRGRARLQDRGDDAAGRAVPRAREHLTALPRISLNGEYQQRATCGCCSRAPRPRCGTASAASTRPELVSATDERTTNDRYRSSSDSMLLSLGRRIGRDSVVCSCRSSSAPAASPAAPSRARRPRSRARRRARCRGSARSLRERHREQRPHDDQHQQRDGADELAQADETWGQVLSSGDIARHCRRAEGRSIWSAPLPQVTGRE